MNKPVVFVASGWSSEVPFFTSIAQALADKGISSHVVALGNRYYREFNRTKAFEKIYDLADWSRRHWKDYQASLYEKISVIEDAYASPSIWRFLAADRFLSFKTYEYNLLTALSQADFWEYYFREHTPLILVGEISHFHNFFAWAISRQKNVPYAHLIPARVPGHCAIGNGPYEHRDMVTRSYRDFQKNGLPDDKKKAAEQYIQAFQSRTGRASHLQPIKKWHQNPAGTGGLRTFLSEIPRWLSDEKHYDYMILSPGRKLSTWFYQLARKASLTMRGVFDDLDALTRQEPFVLFGLHLQPESSTLIRGQFFQDMVAVARNVALSLPAGYRLYVKEHDVMFGRRPCSFYKELKNIPNIVLISPYEQGPVLARQASAIITVTGTFGWDAILLGKPAVVLGEPFFANYDGIEHVSDMTQFPDILQRILKHSMHDLEDQILFVAAVLDNIIPASMDNLWGLRNSDHKNDAAVIADSLIERIQSTQLI